MAGKNIGNVVAVVVTLLCGLMLIALPIGLYVDYQFGGDYNREVYPLQQMDAWLNQANNQVSYATLHSTSSDVSVLADTGRAWVLLNSSENAAGVGAGSPCWLWPTPSQAYGYYQVAFAQTFGLIGNSTQTGGLFNATTLSTNYGAISSELTGILQQPAGENFAGCFLFGNEASVFELVSELVLLLSFFIAFAAVLRIPGE